MERSQELIFSPEDIQISSPGFRQKTDNLSTNLYAEIIQTHDLGVNNALDIHIEKRRIFMANLLNRSISLVKADATLANNSLSEEIHENAQNERIMHLSAEPILATKIFVPGSKKEQRNLYEFFYDIYLRLPRERLFCLVREDFKGQEKCQIIEQIARPKTLEDSLKRLSNKYQLVEKHGGRAIEFLLHELEQSDEVPVQAYETMLEDFPGGKKRFEDLIQQFSSETDTQRLENEIRSYLAERFLDKAIGHIIWILKEALRTVHERSFADYYKMDAFRQGVVSSFEQTDGSNPMRSVHDQMMKNQVWNNRVRIGGEVLYYVGLAATYLINPPAGLCATLLTAARVTASACRAYLVYAQAAYEQEIAKFRFAAGVVGYEKMALARSQYRSAITQAMLEILIPNVGQKMFTNVGKTVTALITSPRPTVSNPQSGRSTFSFVFFTR